jgi:hypothetical protein
MWVKQLDAARHKGARWPLTLGGRAFRSPVALHLFCAQLLARHPPGAEVAAPDQAVLLELLRMGGPEPASPGAEEGEPPRGAALYAAAACGEWAVRLFAIPPPPVSDEAGEGSEESLAAAALSAWAPPAPKKQKKCFALHRAADGAQLPFSLHGAMVAAFARAGGADGSAEAAEGAEEAALPAAAPAAAPAAGPAVIGRRRKSRKHEERAFEALPPLPPPAQVEPRPSGVALGGWATQTA